MAKKKAVTGTTPGEPVVEKKRGLRAPAKTDSSAAEAAATGLFGAVAARINSRSMKEYHFQAANQFFSRISDWVSTTVIPLDCLLWGGIPRGRLTEIHGPPSNGKSSLMEAIFFGNQIAGGLNALIMSEGCLDMERMERSGMKLDPDNFLPVEVESLEQGTAWIQELLTEREKNKAWQTRPLVIAWDTMSNAQEEATRTTGDPFTEGMASKARKVRQVMRNIVPLASRLNVTLIILLQTHARIGQGPYSGTDTDCGGGVKYNSSLRLKIKSVEKIYAEGMDSREIGIYSEAEIVKSKCGPPPFRKAKYPVRSWDGVDNDLAMFEFLTDVYAADPCPTCGGRIAKVVAGHSVWENHNFQKCDACSKSGFIARQIKFQGSSQYCTVTAVGQTAAGHATQWRYICGWPNEEVIIFKPGDLRDTLDSRPGLRTWLSQQCTRKCSKPTPIKLHPVE